jgi:hypothetical protein
MKTNNNLPPAVHEESKPLEPSIESKISRYDLTQDEAKVLCGEFLSRREQKPEGRYGIYLIDGKNIFSDIGRYIESTVLYEYFKNTPEQLQKQYGDYDNYSMFLVGIDHETREPMGEMRIILPSELGQKSLNDLPKTDLKIYPETVYTAYDMDPDKCLDVATIAVAKSYRGKRGDNLTSLLLYRSLYVRFLKDPNYTHVVAILDLEAKNSIDKYKIPFRPILDTEAFSYLESPLSLALIAQTTEYYPQVDYWQRRLALEALDDEDENADEKQHRAAVMKMLKDGDNIDTMLASEITQPVE